MTALPQECLEEAKRIGVSADEAHGGLEVKLVQLGALRGMAFMLEPVCSECGESPIGIQAGDGNQYQDCRHGHGQDLLGVIVTRAEWWLRKGKR